MVGRPDGSQILRQTAEGTDAVKLGSEMAQKLLNQGADKILEEVYRRKWKFRSSHEFAAHKPRIATRTNH